MRSSHSLLAEIIRFTVWSLVVIPFIMATTFSPRHFLTTLATAAFHAARSGDIIVGWVSDAYDFVAPIHLVFRSSTSQQKARRTRVPVGRMSGRGQRRR